jgi:hypothetical protein
MAASVEGGDFSTEVLPKEETNTKVWIDRTGDRLGCILPHKQQQGKEQSHIRVMISIPTWQADRLALFLQCSYPTWKKAPGKMCFFVESGSARASAGKRAPKFFA